MKSGRTAENGNVIVMENLVKRVAAVTAVNHLKLIIHKAEMFGFLGPNGAGKPPPSACCAVCWRRQ